jgi:hypothetical protein
MQLRAFTRTLESWMEKKALGGVKKESEFFLY